MTRMILVGLCAAAAAVAVPPQRTATVVVVVRHAEKDTVPANDPPLTAAGAARAEALAGALAGANVQAVITTQLVRTRETARPLAERLGIAMKTVVRGADIAAHARAVAAAVRKEEGKTVLVVGHGETVGPIIAELGGPRIKDLCANEYSHLFVLVLDGGATRFIRSAYGRPSLPPTDDCVPANTPGQPEPSHGVQFVFTADAHYGLKRPEFRGAHNVASHVVNSALVAEINRLGGLTIPRDGGVGAGRAVGAIDFVVEGGDIANRPDSGIQSAAESWRQFKGDYVDGLTIHDAMGRKSALFIVPGNHDATSAIGYRIPLSPPRDPSAMTAIYNLMLAPVPLRTNATYDYAKDRVHFSRDVGRVHLAFLHIWPDSAERAWLDRDLSRVAPGTPVLLFTHDPPVSDAKHFINPNGDHGINDIDRFDNLLAETFKDDPMSVSTVIEQRAFAAFVKAHPGIRAYFHGHANFSELYQWRGPDGDVALPTFRTDSPMKGKASVTDETQLSFLFAAIDDEGKRMTVREVLWNPTGGRGNAPPRWGAGATVSLRPSP